MCICLNKIYTGSRNKKLNQKDGDRVKKLAPAQTSEKRTTLSMAPLLKNASNCKQREVDSSDEVDSMQF